MNAYLIQTPLHWHDPEANRAMLEEKLATLAQPDLVVLPEMFTTGFSMNPEALAEQAGTATARWLQTQADRLNACILGSVMTHDGGLHYNRLQVARPGEPMLHYDKRHLFRMAGEHNHYQAGRDRLVFEWRGWRICPLVCYDLRFPVYARNCELEYDLLVYVANWPAPRDTPWQALLRARAIENLSYCIGVNRVGEDGNGHPYMGSSQAIGYDGTILLHAGAEEGEFAISLDREALAKFRKAFPAWQDADAFTLHLDGKPELQRQADPKALSHQASS